MTATIRLLLPILLCIVLQACSIYTGTSGLEGKNMQMDPETNLFPKQESAPAETAAPAAAESEPSPPVASPAPTSNGMVFPGTNVHLTVSPGDMEPVSVGSYALRLYSGANPQFPYDDFIAGVIMPRNGALEEVRFADIDRNGTPEIVVVVRSAGSGGYLSADAFRFDGRSLEPVASASFLPADADIEAALQR